MSDSVVARSVAEHLVAYSDLGRGDDEPLPSPVGLKGPAIVALAGRFAIGAALVLVLLASREISTTSGRDRASAIADFWPSVSFAVALGGLGLVSLSWFSVAVARNARRLGTRSPVRPITALASWFVPLGWVALCTTTLLTIEVDAEIDPMPLLAAIGLCVAMVVPYGRLQVALSSLDERAPKVWLLYAFDLFVTGVVWWRLVDWSRGRGEVVVRARELVVYAGAAASVAVLGFLVTVWIVGRTPRAVTARLHVIERRRGKDEPLPPWWTAGGVVASAARPSVPHGPGVAGSAGPGGRPAWGPSRIGLIGGYALWTAAAAAFTVVATDVAFDRRGAFVRASDLDRVRDLAGVVLAASAVAFVLQAVWAVRVAVLARRLTLHAPPPAQMALLYLGGPVLGLAGLAARDTFGDWLLIVSVIGSVALFLLSFRLLETVAVELRMAAGPIRAWMTTLVLFQPIQSLVRLVPPASNQDLLMRYLAIGGFGSLLLGTSTVFAIRTSGAFAAIVRAARPTRRVEEPSPQPDELAA